MNCIENVADRMIAYICGPDAFKWPIRAMVLCVALIVFGLTVGVSHAVLGWPR